MDNFQSEKTLIREYHQELSNSTPQETLQVIEKYTSNDYQWRGVYPFRELNSQHQVSRLFWQPLKQSLSHMQRREDIFIAGQNLYAEEIWVMSMGNFFGLFDQDFLDIPATRRIVNLRYAEFNCIKNGKITQTGLFIDLIGLMIQAGINPLPPSTGVYFNYPGPRYHDGIHRHDADPNESRKTLELLNRMVKDLSDLNQSGSMDCPPELLSKTWHDDMIWYGPAGIGASYSIPRYQEQHQLPFRSQLDDKAFKGHVCRFAEGDFACFFGWPNLTNSPLGGWLGLPGGTKNTSMQVVDVYRREGDKLAENWVFIDLLWWLKQQGLDVLERNRALLGVNQST